MKTFINFLKHTLLNRKVWAYGLFWSWNLIFLAFMFLGFAPQVLPEMITAVRADIIPVVFLIYGVVIILIPALAVILGFTKLRKSPERLFALGYGVEGPLMLLLVIRFFAVRQLTPALSFLLIVAVLGMTIFFWQLLDFNIDARGPWLTHLRAGGLTLTFITGLYASLWVAFYALPLGVGVWSFVIELIGNIPDILQSFWQMLFEINWADFLLMGISFIPFMIFGIILLAYTATLFALMPLAVFILYSKAWWRGTHLMLATYNPIRVVLINAAILLICILLFWQTNQQPQHLAFALLENPPSTPAEAQALLEQQDTIRVGLLNAYLAPHRYFSAVGEVRHIKEMYEWSLNLSPESAVKIQHYYEAVASPILYQPVTPVDETDTTWDNRALQQEPDKAAELYETFFDQTIINGERETIISAVQSTWNVDQAVTARQAVDDREIYLVSQEISVVEQGDWAEIELYEVYQNQTSQREEVIYYFSLPESAVVTGVWLGNSPNRDERSAYRVSPRGAAQAMYREEVRQRVDPALLEQIGPRQYRLRIFPIEPQRLRWENNRRLPAIKGGPALHMWLTWQVMVDEQSWPLPRLAELRNVYWDDNTIRQINGQPLVVEAEVWLPPTVPATSTIEPVTHRVDFYGGQSIIAQPIKADDLPDLNPNLRLAVVLDRSHSMTSVADQIDTSLSQLQSLISAPVDIYLTSSPYRGEAPNRAILAELESQPILYFGGQNAAELLLQYDALHQNEQYDAVLVLTDGTGYELSEHELQIPAFKTPVWMIHVDGNYPLGYDDATLEALQASGGGVATSLAEALTRLAVRQTELTSTPDKAIFNNDPPILDVVDGYLWSTIPTEAVEAEFGHQLKPHLPNDAFVAFSARRLILSEMQRHRGALGQLDMLDYLHDIAVANSVVTPYSSMIVLINERQEKRLDELEEGDDRFQREHEDVGDTQPENLITGVPEPEEWLLLGIITAMLGWYVYNRRHHQPWATR